MACRKKFNSKSPYFITGKYVYFLKFTKPNLNKFISVNFPNSVSHFSAKLSYLNLYQYNHVFNLFNLLF